MGNFLEILLGGVTVGLPIWFAYLDRNAFPHLKWVGEGDPPPPWGRMVVAVGVVLTVLVAIAAHLSGSDPIH